MAGREGEKLLSALIRDMMATSVRRRAEKIDAMQRRKDTLETLLADLYASAKAAPERWLGYSRSADDYTRNPALCTERNRYKHPTATLASVREVVAFLERNCLVETRGGFRTSSGWGATSRIRATANLVRLMDAAGITPGHIKVAPWSETIRLRAAKPEGRPSKAPRARLIRPPLIPYCDTDATHRMRANLAEINAVNGMALIAVDEDVAVGSPEEGDETAAPEEDRPDARDLTAVPMHRVFNRGSFDQGGRFYGAFWQALPKGERRRLLIDGETTVELDFAAMHPRMAYDLSSRPLPLEADPYSSGRLAQMADRELVKKGFMQLLNAGPAVTPRTPPAAAELLTPGIGYGDLLAAIEQEHAPIAPWLRADRGLTLQRLDSEIAER